MISWRVDHDSESAQELIELVRGLLFGPRKRLH
jgi:hypothetical protein